MSVQSYSIDVSSLGIWAPHLTYGEIDRLESVTLERYVFAWISKFARGIHLVQASTVEV